AIAIAAVVLGQAFGGKTADTFKIQGVEAQKALDVLQAKFPAAAGTSAQLVFAAEHGTLAGADAKAAVDSALAQVAGQPDVAQVGALHRAAGNRIAYADVQYTRPASEIRTKAFQGLEATATTVARSGVVRMELGGDLPSQAVNNAPGGQEMIGLLVAIVVLLAAFGSVIAMGLPIGLAIVGLVTSLGLITIVASVVELNSFSPTLATMIGLGVGIDYALFIVTRHREHLHQGMTVEESAGRAIATAGAAVLFAGTTVVIAIAGLAIAGIRDVTLMGLMSGLTVAVMVAIALTLLPALLGFAGHKIDALRVPGMRAGAGVSTRETMWHRWGRQVSAHPWRYLVGSLVVLGLLTAPVFSMRLGMADNGASPKSLTTRRSYDLLAQGFGPGFNGPLLLSVVTNGTPVRDLAPLSAAIAAAPGVRSVAPLQANAAGTAAVLRVIPTTSPQDAATTKLVNRLRNDVIPTAIRGTKADVYVGGQAAIFIDMSKKVQSRLFWFIGAVILLSVVLLMVVFRSVAVPLKAAAMNLLSIGAAYGVIVAVFQWGWMKSVIGLSETVPIVSFMPMMLFAILFGLSMDYEVFLLSRVREEYDRTGDNAGAVADGLAATARVITAAAAIMVTVFASFVFGDNRIVKLFGFGLAFAIFIDATLVRMVLVPATMELLGDRNWWFPRWLDRITPQLRVEAAPELDAELERMLEDEPIRG
ncbi:MAG: hypothetical protein JWL73_3378, partial [Actinomycetia bacterium]|nr:hypothetical protein [Actinomycetes bacterium]